jgi:hypothetical protein
MTDPEGPDQLTPAERSLTKHLELLRSDPPVAPQTMDSRIVRSARWQRSLRRPLLTIEHFAGAIRDGLRLLLMPTDHR